MKKPRSESEAFDYVYFHWLKPTRAAERKHEEIYHGY